MDAATVAGLVFGLGSVYRALPIWSATPVGGGTFGLMSGSVDFKFDRAALTRH